MANTIRHQGIVENINGLHAQVRIVQVSACAHCSIKSHCTTSESKEKLIDVWVNSPSAYHPGDEVWVVGQLSMGVWAVVLAFVVPLVLLVASLFVAHAVTDDEPLAVLCAFLVCGCYYFLLWLNKNRIGRKFAFYIER